MSLTETDRQRFAEHAARLKTHCGDKSVVAVVGKCGTYPEAPWQAFALFILLGAFASILLQLNAVPAGLTFLGCDTSGSW